MGNVLANLGHRTLCPSSGMQYRTLQLHTALLGVAKVCCRDHAVTLDTQLAFHVELCLICLSQDDVCLGRNKHVWLLFGLSDFID